MSNRSIRMSTIFASAIITTAYLAGGVVAKVGGSKLHQALGQEDADSVAMLGPVGFCDRICSHLI